MTTIHQYAIMSAPTTSQYAAIEAASYCYSLDNLQKAISLIDEFVNK